MKRKKKRILIAILVVVIIIGTYVGNHLYRRNIENVEREEELAMIQAELEREREEMLEMIGYSNDMFFQNNFIYNDVFRDLMVFSTMNLHARVRSGEIEISEVVFVNSMEEAEGFADDVFVAWPTEGSEIFLELINGWLDPEERGMLQHADMVIDIDDLDVNLPLARELMVEDWETMIEIRGRLGNETPRRTNDDALRSIAQREYNIYQSRTEEETNED